MAFRTNKMPTLQEKSASGAVASFNTALAMPLASCNIVVNAWQEGSGDPSPVNVRPIHGFDKLHINMCNFNQLLSYKDVSFTAADVNFSRSNNYWSAVGLASSDITDSDKCFNTVPAVIGHKYILGILASDKIKSYDYYSSSFNNRKSGLYMINNVNPTIRLRVCLESGIQYNETFSGIVIDLTQLLGTKLADELYQMEQTETGTGVALFKQIFYKDYYAYNVGGTWVSVASVNGDSYPDYAEIQLGQEVYGAEVDVVNGVAHVTHKVVDMGSRNLTYFEPSSPTFPYGYFRLLPTDKAYGVSNMMCEYYKTSTQPIFTNDFTIIGTRTSYTCYIIDSQHTADNLVDNKAPWLNGYKLVYELYTPFDIQLTPTQIETLIGNNTIFADTGDIDLTYKDLDIAKRGNFREVFKLPS